MKWWDWMVVIIILFNFMWWHLVLLKLSFQIRQQNYSCQILGTPLVIQWLRLHALHAGGPSSIPGNPACCVAQPKKKKKYCVKLLTIFNNFVMNLSGYKSLSQCLVISFAWIPTSGILNVHQFTPCQAWHASIHLTSSQNWVLSALKVISNLVLTCLILISISLLIVGLNIFWYTH